MIPEAIGGRMATNLIAVTSVAARCAGAENADEYWRLLQAARPQFRSVPSDRWAARPTIRVPGSNNRSYSHVMAPMQDPFAFDAQRFRVPRARAMRMDPQQRLAVSLTDELFERSRGDPREASGGRVATVVGVSSTDYRSISAAPLLAEATVDGSLGVGNGSERAAVTAAATRAVKPMSGHTMSGVLANMVAAAVQSVFDLTGPAFTVDAACASSLTALDIACSLLSQGRVNACITGGVYTTLTSEAHVGFSAVGALSPSGKCRPFTSCADGFVIGEGGALLLLKRFEDAARSGDHILGVIEAIGSSNDGRAPGVMTPTVKGQVLAIREALTVRGQESLRVDAIEGHGTGTTVGDQAELETLLEVCDPDAGRPTLLGSAKAIIGHTMAASGALALVKALLALENNSWPPQPSLDVSEPHPLLEGAPFRLAGEKCAETPLRRVAVNSFGFGGTNCHVILATPHEVESHA
ncbi:beta-ketoacyl [acyl carrier protein] synthase domain-containing protein [Tessaracoccus antarcticus]|uniref:beta-ketoacyl [acyl carrier protein] synthase domain-containing protein n=1 Tax=Tessaracoccus antarcticus TaxID=2479848 RepID=UPI0013142ED4|nr:polyketide synthase [Tessaracoccus antarcticus]